MGWRERVWAARDEDKETDYPDVNWQMATDLILGNLVGFLQTHEFRKIEDAAIAADALMKLTNCAHNAQILDSVGDDDDD